MNTRILLIGDSPADTQLIEEMLAESSIAFEISRAQTIDDAVSLLRAESFDIILLDFDLADGQGDNAFSVIHSIAPKSPIIILTGVDDDLKAKEMIQKGAQDYILKDKTDGRMLTHCISHAIERKRSEDALRLREENFHLLFETAPNLIMTVSDEGTIINCNQRAEQILGYLQEELIGNPISMLFREEDIEEAFSGLKKVLSEGFVRSVEFAMVRKDGKTISVKITSAVMQQEDAHKRIICVIEDITEQKRIEQSLAESEDKYRQLVEVTNEGILLMDPEFRITFTNTRMAQMLGYRSEEILERSLFSLTDAHGRELLDRGFEKGKKGVSEEHDIELIHKNGIRLYARIGMSPILDPDGNYLGATAVVMDLTKRKEVEEALLDRLRHESLLHRISDYAVRVDELDSFIDVVLRDIGETINVSRVYLVQYDYEGSTESINYEWDAEGIKIARDEWQKIPLAKTKEMDEVLERKGFMIFDDVMQSADEDLVDILRSLEIKTLLEVPIVMRGRVFGYLGIDECQRERKWNQEDINILISISHTLSTVIERNLIRSAMRMKDIAIASSMNAIAFVDLEGRFTYANPAFLDLLKFKYKDIIGKSAFDLINNRIDAKGVIEELNEQRILKREFPLRRSDGSEIDLELTLNLIPDRSGEVNLCMISAIDVTTLKHAEESLRQSESNYRSIFNSTNDAIVIHEPDSGKIVDMNESAIQMFGYSVEELNARGMRAVSEGQHPYTEENALNWIRKAAKEGPQLFEWHSKNRRETPFWAEVSLKSAEIGGKTRVLAVIRDITDRKKDAEMILQRLRYESLLHSISSEAVRVKNIDNFLDSTLRKIGETTDISRVTIYNFDLEKSTYLITHEWVADGIPFTTDENREGPYSNFEWERGILSRNEVINFSDIEEIPDEVEKKFLRSDGVKSWLAVPIFIKEKLYGGISFDQCDKMREWMEEDVKILTSISNIVADVIERDLAEKELHIKDKAIESSIGAILFTDLSGNLTYVNKTFLRQFGVDDPEDLLGKNVFDFFANPEDADRIIAELQATGYSLLELPVNKSDGSLIFLQLSSSIVFKEDKSPAFIMSWAIDITNRKQMEDERMERQRELSLLLERMNRLIESAPIAIAELDENFGVTLHNEVFQEFIYSFNPGQNIIGVDIFECLPAEFRVLEVLLTKCRDNRQTIYERYLSIRSSSDEFKETAVIELALSPILDPEGSLTGILIILQDLSDLSELERQRDLVLEILKIISSSSDIQIMFDETLVITTQAFHADGALLFLKDKILDRYRLASNTGFSSESLTALNQTKDIQSYELMDFDSEGAIDEVPYEFNSVGPLINRFMKKNGYRSIIWAPMFSEARPLGMIYIFSTKEHAFSEHDFSALKTIADTLAMTIYRQTLRSEVITARGEAATYLDLLCHDIANFTTPVQAYTELMKMDPSLSESCRVRVEFILDQVKRIRDLISRLRRLTETTEDYAREITELDLGNVVHEAMERIVLSYRDKKIEFNIKGSLSDVRVMVDNRISDVFYNILDNAAKYDPSDRVEIDIGIDQITERADRFWRISIVDRGVGIPDDMKDKVFRRFGGYWELKRGFGLGLFLSKMILGHNRGKIWIEDRIEGDHTKGTTVIVILPVAGEMN